MEIKDKEIRKVAVVGLGLMGGSLGLAIKKKLPGVQVLGIDLHPESVRLAVGLGAVDAGSVQLGEEVSEAELIFLANLFGNVCLAPVVPCLSQRMIVTDI